MPQKRKPFIEIFVDWETREVGVVADPQFMRTWDDVLEKLDTATRMAEWERHKFCMAQLQAQTMQNAREQAILHDLAKKN